MIPAARLVSESPMVDTSCAVHRRTKRPLRRIANGDGWAGSAAAVTGGPPVGERVARIVPSAGYHGLDASARRAIVLPAHHGRGARLLSRLRAGTRRARAGGGSPPATGLPRWARHLAQSAARGRHPAGPRRPG